MIVIIVIVVMTMTTIASRTMITPTIDAQNTKQLFSSGVRFSFVGLLVGIAIIIVVIVIVVIVIVVLTVIVVGCWFVSCLLNNHWS